MKRLRAQQLSLVFTQAEKTQVLSPIVAGILCIALWPEVDHWILLSWFFTLVAISFWRHQLTRTYNRSSASGRLGAVWERRFITSLIAASAAWGIGGWLVMLPLSAAYHALVFSFVLGMAAGSSSIYAAHGPSVAAAMTLIIGPSTLYLFTFGDTFHFVLALGGTIFMLAVSRGARLMNRAMHSNAELTAELEALARTDALSGLYNRGAFEEFGEAVVANACRAGRSSAIVMLDVDHFKQINDRTGHAGGDSVIRALGALLHGAIRAGECAGRIGGEEFAVMLPTSEPREAHALALRILGLVRDMRTEIDGETVNVTVSIGVAATGGAASSFAQLLARADAALYAAKSQGRDRVVVAD